MKVGSTSKVSFSAASTDAAHARIGWSDGSIVVLTRTSASNS